MSIPEVGTIEPSQGFAQSRNSGVKPAGLDVRVGAASPGHHSIAWNRCQRQRLPAALQAAFELALLYICRSHTPPADRLHRFEPEFFKSNPVIDPATAVSYARSPSAEPICRDAQEPECPGGPPQIPLGFKAGKCAFARLDCVLQPASHDVDLSQTQFCKRMDVVEASRRRNLRRLAAAVDSDLKPPSAHTVQETCPVMPTGAPARVAGLVDNAADFF